MNFFGMYHLLKSHELKPLGLEDMGVAMRDELEDETGGRSDEIPTMDIQNVQTADGKGKMKKVSDYFDVGRRHEPTAAELKRLTGLDWS